MGDTVVAAVVVADAVPEADVATVLWSVVEVAGPSLEGPHADATSTVTIRQNATARRINFTSAQWDSRLSSPCYSTRRVAARGGVPEPG